jgi:predicted DNA-binding transcriptional regulator AlpA
MSAPLAHVRPVPRRGLSRNEAAMYFGISASTFDKLVAENRIPKPRRIGERKIWDVRELDIAFEALPYENTASSSWEDA